MCKQGIIYIACLFQLILHQLHQEPYEKILYPLIFELLPLVEFKIRYPLVFQNAFLFKKIDACWLEEQNNWDACIAWYPPISILYFHLRLLH